MTREKADEAMEQLTSRMTEAVPEKNADDEAIRQLLREWEME